MNILIKDAERGTLLYGHAVLRQIDQTGQPQKMRCVSMPAEGWIVLLENEFASEPAVQEYLRQVEETNSINPGAGKYLAAVDEVIDVSHEQVDHILESCRMVDEDENENDNCDN